MHKFNYENIERLLREDRLGETSPEEFLSSEGLCEGMVFLDVGCGPGFFTLPAAALVGERGKVFAVDTQPEMIEELKRRVGLEKKAGQANIEPLVSEENSIPVEDASVDFVLLAFVLHELESRAEFFKELTRVMRPGATILVVDWDKIREEHGPPFEDRVAYDDALTLIRATGLEVIEAGRQSSSHYKFKASKK